MEYEAPQVDMLGDLVDVTLDEGSVVGDDDA